MPARRATATFISARSPGATVTSWSTEALCHARLIFLADRTDQNGLHHRRQRQRQEDRRLAQGTAGKGLVSTFETPEALAIKVVTAPWQPGKVGDIAPNRNLGMLRRRGPGARSGRRHATNPLMWVPGSRLRALLGADGAFAARILRLAQIWSAYANIFVASEDKDAEVRVAFDKDGGLVLRGHERPLAVPPSEPTMNLGWLVPGAADRTTSSRSCCTSSATCWASPTNTTTPAATFPGTEEVLKLLGGPPNHWDQNTIDQYLYRTWETDRFPFAKPLRSAVDHVLLLPQGSHQRQADLQHQHHPVIGRQGVHQPAVSLRHGG